jgi:MFS transporter, DHA2 family, multidrug resistance protein
MMVGLIFWELRSPNPVVNFRPLRERKFSACCIIIFCAYALLYSASTSLPGVLQSLFGCLRRGAGHVAGRFFAVLAMPVVGFMLGRKTDARWLMGVGLPLIAVSNYWMSQIQAG